MLSSTKDLAEGLFLRRRDCLARAITLIESSLPRHRDQAAHLLSYIATHTPPQRALAGSPRLRIGVAGPPGAGKSTFIEKLGLQLVRHCHRVAVIPVDPSSHVSGGSILGDKTRMGELARCADAYIRASPTRGVLGGIAEHTVDVISLCEAAGFNMVVVESVGLGQSEVDIDLAVDLLLLLVSPGSGDSLQAAKKGIMEAADLILVNKADGALLTSAQHTKADYAGAMQFIRRKHEAWQPPVMLMSAQTGLNVEEVTETILSYHQLMAANGGLQRKRRQQAQHWALHLFRRHLLSKVETDPSWPQLMQTALQQFEKQDALPARAVALQLLDQVTCAVKRIENPTSPTD